MNSAREKRVEREREAHTEHDVLAESIRLKDKFPYLRSYPSKMRLLHRIEAILHDSTGKVVLDYGCGRGMLSLETLKNGASFVCGIDISPVYIHAASENVRNAGYQNNARFLVMDAHQLAFDDNSFDLVSGNGILHHLDTSVALDEVFRVLKPNGRVVLLEPLADNPLLVVFRFLTPNARTRDEKPLSKKQIAALIQQNNWQTEMLYCGIFNALSAVVSSLLFPRKPDNFLLRFSDKLETWFHKNKILSSWNQYILINMIKDV